MTEGMATLIFSTNYLGQPPQFEHTGNVRVRLSPLVPGVSQLEFWEPVAVPANANRIRVELHDGPAFEGTIKQTDRDGDRRWLSFSVENIGGH